MFFLQDANSNVLVVAQNDSLCVSTGNTIHLISQTGGLSHKQMTTYEFGESLCYEADNTTVVFESGYVVTGNRPLSVMM